MTRVGFGLGTNLGDRLANLRDALAHLKREVPANSSHLLISGIYESEPVDCPEGSPGFLNAVVELETTLPPMDLLKVTQGIEIKLGRPHLSDRSVNAPRLIDIDLLYYGEHEIRKPDLVIPHPRLFERDFVLRPLKDIRPDLVPEDHVFDVTATWRIHDVLSPATN